MSIKIIIFCTRIFSIFFKHYFNFFTYIYLKLLFFFFYWNKKSCIDFLQSLLLSYNTCKRWTLLKLFQTTEEFSMIHGINTCMCWCHKRFVHLFLYLDTCGVIEATQPDLEKKKTALEGRYNSLWYAPVKDTQRDIVWVRDTTVFWYNTTYTTDSLVAGNTQLDSLG